MRTGRCEIGLQPHCNGGSKGQAAAILENEN
jgi:hypothetical protein